MKEKRNRRVIVGLTLKTLIWILLGLCGFIAIISLNMIANQEERIIAPFQPVIFLFPGAVLLVLLILYCNKKLDSFKFDNRIYLFSLLLIIIITQLLIVFCVAKIYPITDCYKTLDESITMCQQNGILNNQNGYFARYPNNYLFTILMYYIFLVAKFVGAPYYIVAVILNVFVIDITIIIGYLLVKELYSVKNANKFLLLSLLCPTNYVFVYFPYTNTFSMPFILGIILCGVKKGYNSKVMFVVLSVIGYCIRPTTIFASIGVVAYFLVTFRKDRVNRKRIAKFVGLCVIVGILIFSEKMFVNAHLSNPQNNKDFPVTHWIMVGLQGTGEVNIKDVEFTESYLSKKDKVNANLETIKDRISELGVSGLSKLYLTKVGKIWGIGTDDFQNLNNSDAQYSKAYEKIFGDENTWLIIYSQIFRCVTFLGIVFMLIAIIRRKRIDTNIIFVIALLGIMIFLMFWETNKKHSICYTPLMLIMMLCGINDLSLCIRKITIDRKRGGDKAKIGKKISLCLSLICILTLSSTIIGHSYILKGASKEKKVVYKSEFNMLSLEGTELSNVCQTLNIPDEFNKIEIHTVPTKMKGDGCLKIKLIDTNLHVIKEKFLYQKDINKKNWIIMDDLNCEPGKYFLKLEGEGDCAFVNVLYYNGMSLEHFTDSSLEVSDKTMGASALSIRVYRIDQK